MRPETSMNSLYHLTLPVVRDDGHQPIRYFREGRFLHWLERREQLQNVSC